jgi:tetratricopeptide (TPR) repeat protein
MRCLTLQTPEYPAVSSFSRCFQAEALIDRGEYEAAAAALGDTWAGIGQRPRIDCYPTEEQGFILLTVGSLTGWWGQARQIEGAQEQAKDLLSESERLFEKAGEVNGWALARCGLAVCYFREGSLDEARIYFQEALEQKTRLEAVTEFKLRLGLALTEVYAGNLPQARWLLEQAELLAAKVGSDLLRGKLYYTFGMVWRRLSENKSSRSYLEQSLESYKRAAACYQKARHQSFRIAVENNLGGLLLALGNYRMAHYHLDIAINYYSQTGERSHAAAAHDWKAQVYLAENKLAKAEQEASLSVKLRREGEENALLAESLITLGAVLARLNLTAKAVKAFDEAHLTACSTGNQQAAGLSLLTCLELLGGQIEIGEFIARFSQANELFNRTHDLSALQRLNALALRAIEDCSQPKNTGLRLGEEDFSLPQYLRQVEKEYIREALRASQGGVVRAAALLGMSHQTLSLALKERHADLGEIEKKPRRRRADCNASS